MNTDSQFINAIEDFMREQGAMAELIRYSSNFDTSMLSTLFVHYVYAIDKVKRYH